MSLRPRKCPCNRFSEKSQTNFAVLPFSPPVGASGALTRHTPEAFNSRLIAILPAGGGSALVAWIARARKMSAIREYFRFLEGVGVIQKSPTTGIETPKREKNSRQYLRSDEYTKMLFLAGANPRDYTILQVFLQTGIRVSELAHLKIEDVDFVKPTITVRGKGSRNGKLRLRKKAYMP
jgi:site-specific recombinase XerC